MLTSNSRVLLRSVAYSIGVFGGAALLGFVVAPFLGIASGPGFGPRSTPRTF
jgi:hypothetical protein